MIPSGKTELSLIVLPPCAWRAVCAITRAVAQATICFTERSGRVRPKLILDTDIGTDVDDAYALLLALGCSEFDLALVTLVHAKLDIRAKIALKMLKLAERLDVPVAAGLSSTITKGAKERWAGHEGTETDFSDIKGLTSSDDAVDSLLRMVEGNPGSVIVAPIGPLTNIAAAIGESKETMRKVRRIVAMASVFRGTGLERAAAEHNARVDPDATAIVLESGLPVTLVGLNVTLQALLTSAHIHALRGVSALGDYTAQMGEQFLRVCARTATWMHDPLAVAIAARPEMAVTRRLAAKVVRHPVSGESVVQFDEPVPGRPTIDVCVDVDIHAFEKLFFSRITSIVKGVK